MCNIEELKQRSSIDTQDGQLEIAFDLSVTVGRDADVNARLRTKDNGHLSIGRREIQQFKHGDLRLRSGSMGSSGWRRCR